VIAMTSEDRARPRLAADVQANRAAERAVAALVEDLQVGMDEADAERSDRRFARDVAWGGPFGTTVNGIEELLAIHRRLKAEGAAGRSRYEVRRVLAPAPGVAVAQVARLALDESGDPLPAEEGFSEMAQYVLVERDGEWWLAAGQNTPLQPSKAAGGT
jgi:uncharacterized protein (TIGR02246 family)